MDSSPLTNTTTEWVRTPQPINQPVPDPSSPKLHGYTYGSLSDEGVFIPFEVGTCCGYPISQMNNGCVSPVAQKVDGISALDYIRTLPSPNPYTTGDFAISMAMPTPRHEDFYFPCSLERARSASTVCVEPSLDRKGN